MNTILKTIGLFIFLTGFGIFLSLFFFGPYKLEKEHIQKNIRDENKKAAFIMAGEELIHKEIPTFEFISELKKVFAKVNHYQTELYSVNNEQLNAIVKLYEHKSPFTFELVKSASEVLKGDSEFDFKLESLKKYGGWLDQRSYSDTESLKTDLISVKSNIEKYEIISQKGFDKYEQKFMLTALSKSSNLTPSRAYPHLFIFLTFVLCVIGAALYILPKASEIPGIKNNHIFNRAMTNVGWLGILTGTFLITFYVFLYYFPEYMTAWIILVDPISIFLKGQEAGRFFLYGFIYTLCILVMGFRMILKYRHSKYQVLRTLSVMFFQTSFAFLIPEILLRLNKPYFDFKNIWPLDYDFFFDNELNTLISNGGLGIFMLVWGIALIIIAVPVLVYFFGKRWYCSWVCGCGGLAETLGDPYRQLSNKTLKAWQIERWMIHSVLVFAIVMTFAVLYTFFTGESEILGLSSYKIRETYGAWIGAGFAGVIGTGFYPLMGNRVWCRFGCPLAAYLGIVQKFKSRFRITTNGGQCISCGNCSTYCEMGIDVRWYAQRGQNIIRSSCVGCGVCSSVCPRGVLNLEVKNEKGRYNEPILIGMDRIELKAK